MRIEVAGSTHVGMKRSHNEDNYLVLPDERLFCVADGMGGHSSGEIASKIAVDEMADFFKLTSGDQDVTWPFKMDKARNYDENRLATGIKLANARIYERSTAEPRYKGMGTTLVSAHFTPSAVYVGHVGDSRVYLFRAGQLKQLTEDHSLLNDYLKAKKLTPEEIENFPHKNVIVRALGMKDTVKVDTRFESPRAGDVYLLCSDGLSGPVEDPEMLEIIQRHGDLKVAASKLIERANENGGPDNITVVLSRWVDDH
jgi:PPM family protein phosphatase